MSVNDKQLHCQQEIPVIYSAYAPAIFLKCFHNKMITITPMWTTHTHTLTHTHTRSGLPHCDLQYSLLPWRRTITVPCRASVQWLVSCSWWGSALEETDQKENENWLRVERAIWEKRMVSVGEGREDDRWTDSSRDGWMDESENSGFWDNTLTVQYVYDHDWCCAASPYSS